MLETLRQIDEVRLNFDADSTILLNLTIALIMFGIALELRPVDFIRIFKQPRAAFVGILSQFLLLPMFTFLLAIALHDFITPTVGLGMILVAACPGGNISNFISSLARGNVALSVSLTAFSSISSLILTPFNFAFWGNLFIRYYANVGSSDLLRPLVIDAVGVFQTIFIILGLPLFLGIFFNMKFHRLAKRVVIHFKRFSIVAFAAIVIVIFASNYDHFLSYIKYIFILVLLHNAFALTIGYQTARLLGLNKINRRTISIETGIQNSGLALALLFNPRIFPGEMAIGGMAFIAAWWGVWHILAGLSMAGYWSGFSLKPAEETA